MPRIQVPGGAPSGGSLPTQTGNNGKFLTTDGSNPSWASAAGVTETVNTQASVSGAYTVPDVTTATIHRLTLTGNATLTFPSAAAGKSFTIVAVQDATGSRTITWPTVKWPGAIAPTLSTGANKIDYLAFVCTDGSTWVGALTMQDVR